MIGRVTLRLDEGPAGNFAYTHVGEIQLDAVGDVIITIGRRDDGSIIVQSAEVKPSEFWREIEVVVKHLEEFKTKLGDTVFASQFLSSALYSIKRYIG